MNGHLIYRSYTGKVERIPVRACPDVPAALQVLEAVLDTAVTWAPTR